METAKAVIPLELLEDVARLTNLYEELQEGTQHPTEYQSKLKMTLSQIERKLEL